MHPHVIICLGIKHLNRFWVEKVTSSMNMALISVRLDTTYFGKNWKLKTIKK